MEQCYWHEDGDGSAVWATGCGRRWYFTEGSPQDNGIKFCFGCGKPAVFDEPGQALNWEITKGVTRSYGEGNADVKDPSDGFIGAMLAAIQVDRGNAGPFREQLEPGSAHLTVSGRFQSDKYPWCAAGFVPIKTSDPMAQDLVVGQFEILVPTDGVAKPMLERSGMVKRPHEQKAPCRREQTRCIDSRRRHRRAFRRQIERPCRSLIGTKGRPQRRCSSR